MEQRELIQLLIAKDEGAYQTLVNTYRIPVFNTVLNILHDEDEADDTAQEVFIQIFYAIDRFKGDSSLSTWIYRIAIRKALDKLRQRKNRQRLQQLIPWWMPDEEKSASDNFYHPGVLLENKERAATLFKAIDKLPENQKVAFNLIKVQGMKYEEACEIMQQSVKAIESLISRAKQNLQKTLEHYRKDNDHDK